MALMARVGEEADTDSRYRLLGEAQVALADDAVNGFLFQLAKHGVWKTGIEGLWHDSPVQANDLTAVRWVE